MKKKKYAVYVVMVLFIIVFAFSIRTNVFASGLVDDKVDTANEYSKYALDNYQLDFYVDQTWDWLPWNWTDGIGKQVTYGIHAISNFIWTINLYISNATGYIIQEAYNLDFISDTAEAVGKNIQVLAGISKNGFANVGFYTGFLLLLILVLGVYVTYTGIIKRESAKAIQAVISFVAIFILSSAIIACAPDYIKKINEFSTDVSQASLVVGTKIVTPQKGSTAKSSVDLIRNNLFEIQVKKTWLLLQFGSTDEEAIGNERIENILSNAPNSKAREENVKKEIEEKENTNLTITKTVSRLGTVFFLFIFNIGITVFVFLLTGMMIFSQVLFIMYATFLPIACLFSMIPSYNGMLKKAVMKLFNTMMMRAGLTLIITVAFSISSMLYAVAGNYPFFLIAFLQVVTFAGIYYKLGDLLSMFSLQGNDTQHMGRRIFQRPYTMMRRQWRQLTRMQKQSARAKNQEQSGGSGRNSRTFASGTGQQRSNARSPMNGQAGHGKNQKNEMVSTSNHTQQPQQFGADKNKEKAINKKPLKQFAEQNSNAHQAKDQHPASKKLNHKRQLSSRNSIESKNPAVTQPKPMKERALQNGRMQHKADTSKKMNSNNNQHKKQSQNDRTQQHVDTERKLNSGINRNDRVQHKKENHYHQVNGRSLQNQRTMKSGENGRKGKKKP